MKGRIIFSISICIVLYMTLCLSMTYGQLVNTNNGGQTNGNSKVGTTGGNTTGGNTSDGNTTDGNTTGNIDENTTTIGGNTTNGNGDTTPDDNSIISVQGNNKNNTGECASNKSTLGMFSFHRPISKNILVINSNFTVIWYYNNLVDNPSNYNYPTSNITLKLFYEEDADSNNWSNSWKKPVWIKTLSLDEIEMGPTLSNNVKSYQWNWLIIPSLNDGFIQTPKSNQKYKLRIYGDGKDIQSNSENFQCYSNYDLQPGVTRPFYIVENGHIADKYYHPIDIPDKGYSISRSKTSILFAIIPFLYYYYYHL